MPETANKVIKGASLMLLLRLFQRSLGLISTLILARILAPEDFGLVAIVTIVGLFFNVLTQTGSEQYIVQKNNIEENDLHAAFSLDVMTKSSIWIVFLASTPFISHFYDEPQLTLALIVSSFILPIGALISPKLYILKKNINFKSFVKLEGFRKVFSFIVVLSVLFFEQSFWAIVFGDIASISFAVIGSYFIAPFKPKLIKTNIAKQWLFSKWMLAKGIFGFTRSQIDTFLVSSFFGVTELGKYHMAKHVAYIPATDIITPASEPILSALADSKTDKDLFKSRFLQGLFITLALTIPLGLFIAYFKEPLVDFLLGSKWQHTYEIMSILGIAMLFTCFNHFIETSMIALAKVRFVFIFDVVSMALLVTGLLLYPGNTIEEFTTYRTLLLGAFSAALFYFSYFFIRFNFWRLVILILPIIVSSLTAVTITESLKSPFTEGNSFAIFYLGSVFVIITSLLAIAIYLLFYKKYKEVDFIFSRIPGLKKLNKS